MVVHTPQRGLIMMTRYVAVLRTIVLVVMFSHAVWVQAAQGPQVKQSPVDTPKRILFVGNSFLYYNDSLPSHVRRIAVAADPASEKSLQYKSATIGGAPLAHHNSQHLLEPGNLGMKQPFDMVILQEASRVSVVFIDNDRLQSQRARLRERQNSLVEAADRQRAAERSGL